MLTKALLQWRAEQLLGQTSRAGSAHLPSVTVLGCFNGGPSNCSAKLVCDNRNGWLDPELQWRAEQLLGQTSLRATHASCNQALQWRAEKLLGQTALPRRQQRRLPGRFNGGPSNCSAKPPSRSPSCRRSESFNGGPSNCSAKPARSSGSRTATSPLQWRAEQLLGQTSSSARPGRL